VGYKIGVIGGDGIGPEVIAEALKVVRAVGVDLDTVDYDLGGTRWLRDGAVLPDDVLEDLRGLDAILLGAVGDPRVPPGLIERGLLLRMRFALDLYVNLRPFDGFSVVRENTEGSYAGGLWQRTFDEVAAEHPEITTAYCHVDAACIHLVEDPARFDVIVTDNLFGDILTDLAGAVSGGIGLAASANLNPERTGPSLFEPVHGSAPDIAGTGRANPLAAIRSAAMMLEFLGEASAATRVAEACTVVSGRAGTTVEIGDAVAERI